MKLNKLLNNTYYLILLLVPLGWVLNWKYYFSRFQSEGFVLWVSIMISCTLVVFASFVFGAYQFLKRKKNKMCIVFLIAYCILAFYSINCTTAGQYWDQQIKNKETHIEQTEKDNQEYILKSYQEKLESLQSEYDKLNAVKDASIENLGDLFYYRNTTKTIEQMKDELKIEIKEYEIKIEDILNQNKISAKAEQNKIISKSLYQFYYKKNPVIPQFFFQVLLAAIIESIAQISIYIFMKIQNLEEYEKQKEKIIVLQNELKHFTVHAWEGIRRGQTKYLMSKEIIFNNVIKLCKTFTIEKYRQIIRTALKKGLLKKQGKEFFPGSEWVDTDYFYKKMCEYLNFT